MLDYALTDSAGNWNWRGTGVPVRANVWTHVVFGVVRSSNTLYIYVNGRWVYTSSGNTANVPSSGYNSTGGLTIGARENGPWNSKYTGSIDEVRLYNVSIASPAAAEAAMNTWGPGNASGLVGYWDFNEGSGSTIANSVTSPASGTSLTSPSAPTWTDVKSTTTTGPYVVTTFPRSYLTSAGGWTVPTGVTKVDALIIGGGGGGGNGSDGSGWSGGGGGAGGLATLSNSTVTPGSVQTVTVGGGGVRASSNSAP